MDNFDGRLEYASFLKTMERARAEAQPSIPQTLVEYAADLGDIQYRHLFLTYNEQPFFKGFINGGIEVGEVVVFVSPEMIK